MNRKSLIALCGTAAFVALTVVMQLTLGTITVAAVNLNFVLIPIVVSGIIFGVSSGAAVGAAFGIVTFIQCITGAQPFGNALFNISWLGTFVAVVPRGIIIGIVAPLVYKGLKKLSVNNTVSLVIASAAVPLVNTLIFLGCMVLFFTPAMQEYAAAEGVNVFNFLFVSLAGVNALIEVLTTALIAPPVTAALLKAKKNM